MLYTCAAVCVDVEQSAKYVLVHIYAYIILTNLKIMRCLCAVWVFSSFWRVRMSFYLRQQITNKLANIKTHTKHTHTWLMKSRKLLNPKHDLFIEHYPANAKCNELADQWRCGRGRQFVEHCNIVGVTNKRKSFFRMRRLVADTLFSNGNTIKNVAVDRQDLSFLSHFLCI